MQIPNTFTALSTNTHDSL